MKVGEIRRQLEQVGLFEQRHPVAHELLVKVIQYGLVVIFHASQCGETETGESTQLVVVPPLLLQPRPTLQLAFRIENVVVGVVAVTSFCLLLAVALVVLLIQAKHVDITYLGGLSADDADGSAGQARAVARVGRSTRGVRVLRVRDFVVRASVGRGSKRTAAREWPAKGAVALIEERLHSRMSR